MGKKKSAAGRCPDVPPPAEMRRAEDAPRVPGEAVAEVWQAQEAPRVFGEVAEMPRAEEAPRVPGEAEVPIIEDLEVPIFLGAAPPRAAFIGVRYRF